MRNWYVFWFFIIIGAIGLLLYPTAHSMISTVNTDGWLPLMKAGLAALPYGFLFFVGYAVWKLTRG